MVKASMFLAGRTVKVIGLSHENVVRLRAGNPIHFNGAEIGLSGVDFVITYGETEDQIVRDLKLAPETTGG